MQTRDEVENSPHPPTSPEATVGGQHFRLLPPLHPSKMSLTFHCVTNKRLPAIQERP